MALKYTVERLNNLDKDTIIQLLEQMAYLKRHRFSRSSVRHEDDEQISFMEHHVKVQA